MLPEEQRYELYFGPYSQPEYKYGEELFCECRGWMKVVSQSYSPIPWPIGCTIPRAGRDSLILCGDLERAVKNESAQAVVYWWGASRSVVTTELRTITHGLNPWLWSRLKHRFY